MFVAQTCAHLFTDKSCSEKQVVLCYCIPRIQHHSMSYSGIRVYTLARADHVQVNVHVDRQSSTSEEVVCMSM